MKLVISFPGIGFTVSVILAILKLVGCFSVSWWWVIVPLLLEGMAAILALALILWLEDRS